MVLPIASQNTFNQQTRVKRIIDANGDTLIQFRLSDAKRILSEVLTKANVDSIVRVYTLRDSLNTDIITLNTKEIEKLNAKCANKDIQLANLTKIISNDTTELVLKDQVIKQQKKEIRKQKTLKVLALIGDIALPILVIILLH